MTKVRLDVVSDVVCPWCWLGKRRLDAALATLDDLEVELTFRAFQLDPDVPKAGVDYRAYMTAKFGDLSRIEAGQTHLTDTGAALGMTYRFAEIPNRPNTLDAHRLIRWATGQGKGPDAVEALFRAHFEELKDVGDAAALADIADAIGMDRALVTELLGSDRDVDEIRKEETFFRELGITGVPTFIANGRTAVQGAQESETLVRFLRAAAEMKDVRRA
jgi:predicted DsbA family dithiol-disulfide isomerase